MKHCFIYHMENTQLASVMFDYVLLQILIYQNLKMMTQATTKNSLCNL